MKYESQFSETITYHAHNGDLIDAYIARPLGAGPFPSVVIIHHMPGWDVYNKEIARRFAHHGYAAISPNLHFREGKNSPEENSSSIRAAGGMPDDRTMGDVQSAIKYMRALPFTSDKVGVIGYCSGGRQSFLAGCILKGIDAVVSCYGGGVVAKPEELTSIQPIAPLSFTKDMQCPILGLFGVEDTRPSPEDVLKTENELKKFNKTYEFVSYEHCGHAFFAVDRPQYRVHAALDGWKRVLAWFEKYLSH
jgi:carboxymethylenebutenolidase